MINTNILALDLVTNTGWAVRRRDGTISYGTEKFQLNKKQHPGQRWINFQHWLHRILESENVHQLVFENVVFGHSSSAANNAYGAFLGFVQACAATRNIECLGVAVPTVKKAWTGSGRADKAAMIEQAKKRGFDPDSDNAADALAILSWAVLQEA